MLMHVFKFSDFVCFDQFICCYNCCFSFLLIILTQEYLKLFLKQLKFLFPGSLILFDILSNQKDLASSVNTEPFSGVNGTEKDMSAQDKQVTCILIFPGKWI